MKSMPIFCVTVSETPVNGPHVNNYLNILFSVYTFILILMTLNDKQWKILGISGTISICFKVFKCWSPWGGGEKYHSDILPLLSRTPPTFFLIPEMPKRQAKLACFLWVLAVTFALALFYCNQIHWHERWSRFQGVYAGLFIGISNREPFRPYVSKQPSN